MAVHTNLSGYDNPIAKVSRNLWKCPSMDKFLTKEDFCRKFDISSKEVQCDEGQSLVCFFKLKDQGNKGCMVKYYDLTKKNASLASVWTELVLVTQTKLLLYATIYYFKEENQALLVMEPLKYSLSYYVDFVQKDIDEAQCKMIILEVLDKLWKMHKSGFIHCDLKPDNIMFKHSDNKSNEIPKGWKIIDFGLMMKYGNEENKNDNDCKDIYRGTPGWTPPEICIKSNDNKYSWTTDIWSIGLIILYILFKVQPYTLSEYERDNICKNDWSKIKEYFYHRKLLQKKPSNMDLKGENDKGNIFKKMLLKASNIYKNDKIKSSEGELHLHKYLKNLYLTNKITSDLYDMLKNHILVFDPSKRSNCAQIYQHKWFDQCRNV